jgi:hypothetical protein
VTLALHHEGSGSRAARKEHNQLTSDGVYLTSPPRWAAAGQGEDPSDVCFLDARTCRGEGAHGKKLGEKTIVASILDSCETKKTHHYLIRSPKHTYE